jgi:hypothetical protein
MQIAEPPAERQQESRVRLEPFAHKARRDGFERLLCELVSNGLRENGTLAPALLHKLSTLQLSHGPEQLSRRLLHK